MTIGDLVLRLLLASGIILLGLGLYWVARRVILARVRGRRLGLESIQPGIPAVLYFTTPECIPCKTYQRPQLQLLQDRLGKNLQIIEIDAAEQPDLASYWGVLSVPTTFIIDTKGQARGMNFGSASAEKLHGQILEVESLGPDYELSEEGASR